MTVTSIRVVLATAMMLAVATADAQYRFPGPPPGSVPPPGVPTWSDAYGQDYQSAGLGQFLQRGPAPGPDVRQAAYQAPGNTSMYGGGATYAGGTPVAGGGTLMGGPGGPMVSGPTTSMYAGGMAPGPVYQDDLGPGRRWMEPWNASPTDCPPGSVGYNQGLGDAGSVGVFGGQGADNPAGGARWQLGQFGLLRGIDAGVYANDDQTVFSGGATLGLYDVGHFFVGTRVLGNAVVYPEGPTAGGLSVDVFASKRVDLYGWEHYFKVGYFYDGQREIRRHGPEVAGILFTNDRLPDLTFDIAVGIGNGSGMVEDQFVQAAEVETQLRGGLQFTEWLNLGVRGTFAKFDDPGFRDVGDFGGYGSIDLGNILLNVDVGGGRDNARGFINLVWQPDYGYPARHPRVPTTITQTGHDQKYAGWMSRPVLRDISMRTGTPVNEGPDETPVGNISQVLTAVRFPSTRGVNTQDSNGNGVADGGESFEVDFIFRNLTGVDSFTVQVTTASATGPVVASFLGTTPVQVAPGLTVTTNANQGVVVDISPLAATGDVIVLTFNVTADGETRTFTQNYTVGAIANGQIDLANPL